MVGAERRRRLASALGPAPQLALLALLLGACDQPGPFRVLSVREQTAPQLAALLPAPDVELGATAMRLVDGIAIQARISAIDDDGEPMPVLELLSADPSVFDVTRAPELGRFVFFGASPGTAELLIRSDGHRVGTIPVTVVPQQTPR